MQFKLLLPRLTLALWLPVILLALAACGSESEAPAPNRLIALAKTGQTVCFNRMGNSIDCAGTGMDGELQTGVAEPSPRFVVGTGAAASCVTDSLTGLMWTQNANLPAVAGAPSTGARTWQDALTFTNGLTLCGYSDWRLPNRKELFSLTNYNSINNALRLNTEGFSNVQTFYYWSSSIYAGDAAYAWIVYMYDGSVLAGVNSVSYFVWPVRAGQ